MPDRETSVPPILLVDDDRALTRVLRTMLEVLGHPAEEAGNTDGLVERVLASPPSVLVLDYNLPGRSGVDLLKDIRSRGGEDLVVLFLTGEVGNHEAARMALEAGALDYLVKPITMERLQAAVHVALEVRALRVENRRLRERLAEIEAAR